MFDHDAMTTALQPPQLKIGGQVHTGRVLSYPEYVEWVKKFTAWSAGAFDGPDHRSALHGMFTDLGFTTEAVDRLLAGPPAGISGAARDFFAHQWRQPEVAGNGGNPSGPAAP